MRPDPISRVASTGKFEAAQIAEPRIGAVAEDSISKRESVQVTPKQRSSTSLDISPSVGLSCYASSPMGSTPVCTTPLSTRVAVIATETPSPIQSSKFSPSALLRLLTNEKSPQYGFLSNVQDGVISALIRAETLLWVKELIQFHDCDDDVFVCTVQLLDQLLSATKMKAKHMRVASVACFLVAAKCLLEEADQPLVADLGANCSPEFTANDLKRMELVLLDKLKWQVPSISPLALVRDLVAFSAAELGLADICIDNLMDAVTEKYVSCAISYELLRFKPSVVASAILVGELQSITQLSHNFLLSMLSTELGVDSSVVKDCERLVGRHMRITHSRS